MEAMSQVVLQFRKTLSDPLAGNRLENDDWGCLAITMDSGDRTQKFDWRSSGRNPPKGLENGEEMLLGGKGRYHK